MRSDLLVSLLDSLDDESLAAVAARLGPHLPGADADVGVLCAREAAERLGLHERTVARLAREGRIQGAFKVGRGWRFLADQLAALPAARTTDGLGGTHGPATPARNAPHTSVRAIRGDA